MSKYVVIHDFTDLQDSTKGKNKVYRSGDSYPTPANKKITDERIAQLSGKNNRLGVALISEVKEEKKADSKNESKTETKTESK